MYAKDHIAVRVKFDRRPHVKLRRSKVVHTTDEIPDVFDYTLHRIMPQALLCRGPTPQRSHTHCQVTLHHRLIIDATVTRCSK